MIITKVNSRKLECIIKSKIPPSAVFFAVLLGFHAILYDTGDIRKNRTHSVELNLCHLNISKHLVNGINYNRKRSKIKIGHLVKKTEHGNNKNQPDGLEHSVAQIPH